MAVFVAGSDETSEGDQGGYFLYGGFVAPQREWDEFFAPAWQQYVLSAPPVIEYMHVSDIKREAWQIENGLTLGDVEHKLDEACRVIRGQGHLFPVVARLNQPNFKSSFKDVPLFVKTPGGPAKKPFDPDLVCFLRFALHVLFYVHEEHPEAEKVDFVVERNGQITDRIKLVHCSLITGLRQLKRPDLAALVGDLIPGGKDRVPLQAADLLCWYTRRRDTLSKADQRRYMALAQRQGRLSHADDDEIAAMADQIRRDSISDGGTVGVDLFVDDSCRDHLS